MIAPKLSLWLLAGHAAAFLLPPQAPSQLVLHHVSSSPTHQLDGKDDAPDSKAFLRGKTTLKAQTGDVCQSYGEKQWTGTVDVSDERRLFFWFAESRNDPQTDPIIIWMNGGPGASSMLGLFTEMGPCILDANSTHTLANPHSWNNNASVLFLDQPAGSGFSSIAPGASYHQTDHDGAADFQFFLNVFFHDLFPSFAKLPMHIAGESYGGHFVPTYVQHILQSRDFNSRDAFQGNISSLIFVNALMDMTATIVGSYELLCTGFRGQVLNETACQYMADHLPECERLGGLCRLVGGHEVCQSALDYCMSTVAMPFIEEQIAGKRSSDNIHRPCPDFPLCSDPSGRNVTAFLNQPRVIAGLGFSESTIYREMGFLLDWPHDGQDRPQKLRILAINGNEDYIVNTPSVISVYDSIQWKGQAQYRTAGWKKWQPEDASRNDEGGADDTGMWKQSADKRLVLIGLDGAGHTVPEYVPESSLKIIDRWISGWDL